jgi:predicted unusual protein kinase regulating ubiquinone biosynthesis (AarF/ABC1/UbiB family)
MKSPERTPDSPESSEKPTRFRKSRSGRFLKIAALASKLSSSYLGQKIKKAFISDASANRSLEAAHLRNARRVAKAFGELKGAVMKVGQMLSGYHDILPREYTGLLSSLQKQAPPVKFETIAKQLELELERPIEEVFETLDEKPFASASIGQVHKGVLHDGRQVAVKVQYPDVDKTVASDVKNLRLVLRSMGLLSKERGIEELVAEVQARLVEELDYRLELANLKDFGKLLADDERVVVPLGIEAYTTQRVLCMEFVHGKDFADVCEKADQSRRDEIGQAMLDLFCRQFFGLRVLHADPNPANFSFLDDGRIVFYDFGCVRHYAAEFISDYARLVDQTLDGHLDALPKNLERIGVVPIGGASFGTDFFAMFAGPLIAPFAGGTYDFGQAKIHDEIMRFGMEHWKDSLKFRAPPEVVFLDRVIIGMYNNLRALHAKADWRAILKPHLEAVSGEA